VLPAFVPVLFLFVSENDRASNQQPESTRARTVIVDRNDVEICTIPRPASDTRIERDASSSSNGDLGHRLYRLCSAACPSWVDEIHMSHGFILRFKPVRRDV
jgi:hypothetical protein